MAQKTQKILVISMAGIGDTILATPLIRELRANFPDAQIDALVLWSGSMHILDRSPHLNQVYQRNLLNQSRLESFQFLLSIRKNRYDISINTHPQSRRHYRVIARIVGAPLRISHVYESFGAVDGLLVNQTLPQDYARHSVDMNLDVLGLVGARPRFQKHELEIPLLPEDEAWAEAFLTKHHLQGRKTLGVHAGSGSTKNLALKRWPIEQYVLLVRKLRQSRPELGILLFGGPDEEGDIQKIIAGSPSPLTIRVDSPTLRAAGALMKRGTAFLSVDTALMHLAAAVKAPHQIVIEAVTLNKTNEPYAHPYIRVPNPAVAGRNLDYYKYDGQGIKGTPEELAGIMKSISVDAVHETVLKAVG